MKLAKHACLSAFLLGSTGSSFAQSGSGQNYENFILQFQDSGVRHQIDVAPTGTRQSPLPINPGGARFELHTLRVDPGSNPTSQLLATKYVHTYNLTAPHFMITSADPYALTPRTRADKPFTVHLTINGLKDGETDPEASKKVLLKRHTQSYGADGEGSQVDRNQAAFHSQVYVEQNGAISPIVVPLTEITGADRRKIRGEERFSVFTLPDYQVPTEQQIGSVMVQVWPVADGKISGISDGQLLRFDIPSITITLDDLYPDSQTFIRAYPKDGDPETESVVIAGSGVNCYETVPQNRVIVLDQWDEMLESEGEWILQLLTRTPFDVTELDIKSVILDRSIKVNATLTSME